MKNNINCIILCAGAGTRMKSETKNKVCFEIMGKPAVVRVIENLKKCGIEKFVVVVGSKSESVMNAVSHIDGVNFVYQREQKGTGNAAMCALKMLNDFNIDGPVLTVMGDKLIDSSVFNMLINDFFTQKSDISLITQPAEFNESGGKIVLADGNVAAIVEHTDLLLLMVREEMAKGGVPEDIYKRLKLSAKQVAQIETRLAASDNQAENCFIEINGTKLSSADIMASKMVNCATYLHSREAINSSIQNLRADNAQNEIYFTDTISEVAKYGKVSYVKISDRKQIHTFNTPEELAKINNYFKEEGLND